jgi:SAM-dependent methyltransferase
VAAAWVHDYARPIRAMVLATPAFRIKLYVPFAIPALRALQAVRPRSFVKSYVRPSMLTGDRQQAEAYANDALVSPHIAVNVLLDLHDASERLVEDAAVIHTPTLMFVSGKDYVVDQDVQRSFFDRLSSSDKRIEVLPEALHSTFWDTGRDAVIRQSADFIRCRLQDEATAPDSSRLSEATTKRYRTLQQPASLPKAACYAIQKRMLSTVGRLSRGVRIGWASGFDSGQSLDHVYRNRAEGTTPIGRIIDRCYLNTVGWKGIRQRKVHLEELLDRAIAEAVKEFGEVRILDIAAGPGRYALETLVRNKSLPLTAVLCDRDPGGLAEGRRLAATMGLSDRVEYRFSDAFDPDAIRRAGDGKPVQIAIVSGLYELFAENASMKRSLSGLADVVAPGGRLIYTTQPWHPQQEMIARVLPNRDGEPWVMRCRSQAEMNALVEEAGFEYEGLRVDRWGIFSVASARNSRADR